MFNKEHAKENYGRDSSGFDGDESSEPRARIRFNSGANHLTRGRKSEYSRILNSCESMIQTIKDSMVETEEDRFAEVYRVRPDGKSPITLDSEFTHRLNVCINSLQETFALFKLESLNLQGYSGHQNSDSLL